MRKRVKDSWQQVPGQLVQLDISGDRFVGVDSKFQVFYRKGAGSSWEQLDGSFKQVSVNHQGEMVGVSTSRELCYKLNSKSSWVKMQGQFDSGYIRYNAIIACNIGHQVFLHLHKSQKPIVCERYRVTMNDFVEPSKVQFKKLEWKLRDVAQDIDGQLWGLTEAYTPVFSDNRGETWSQVNGAFRQISVSHGIVYALDMEGQLYRRKGLEGQWKSQSKKLVQVCVDSYETVYGIDADNELRMKRGKDGKWVETAWKGKFSQIDVCSGNIVGVDISGKAVLQAERINSMRNSIFAQLSVDVNGQLVGCTPDKRIFYKRGTDKDWQQLPLAPKSASLKNNRIVACTQDNTVYISV